VKRAFLILLGLFQTLRAEVSLPEIFGDHMMLQQGVTLPVWGTAAPGEHVSVLLGERQASTVADAAGRWRVTLRPLFARGESLTLVVNGSNRLEFRDVLVGEVWVAAGGANMAMPLSEAPLGRQPGASDPDLRFFLSGEGLTRGRWVTSRPEDENVIPAIGYFFARDLARVRHVPAGVILVTSEAPIREWIPARNPAQVKGNDGSLFRKSVTPIIPYAVSGFLWYPDKSDEGPDAPLYRVWLTRLIRSWRKAWGEGPLPFYSVLPAGFGDPEGSAVESFRSAGITGRGLPWIREGVLCSLALPMTGVASATDLGEPDDHLPVDKLDVGRRLALLARGECYGEERCVTGPLVRSYTREPGCLRVLFGSTGGGLVIGQSPWRSRSWSPELASEVRGFALSGTDGKWYPATGRIEGESVVLSSDSVPDPVEVRYDWKGFPVGNLYNREGLPAFPFRSDSRQPE